MPDELMPAGIGGKEIRTIKTLKVGKPGASPEAGCFRKVSRTLETEEAIENWEVEELPCCLHGHTIHNPAELGGNCVVCGNLLCKACAERFRCFFDNNLLCAYCCSQDRLGHFMCSNAHGFHSKYAEPIKNKWIP